MAGHSHFANIRHKKDKEDQKRAKIFTQLLRLITIAAKTGNDPEFNSKLAIAISDAKYNNVPRDKIENAIKKASSNDSIENLEDIRYNISLPNGIYLIIDALTDNKNRTISFIREYTTKANGKILETGSIEFNFDKIGIFKYKSDIAKFEEFFNLAINFDPINIEKFDEFFIVEVDYKDFHLFSEKFIKDGLFKNFIERKIIWKPKELKVVSEEEMLKISKLIDDLDNLNDVQEIYINI